MIKNLLFLIFIPPMAYLFAYFYEYYYIVLILQAFCVVHAVRRGRTNQQNWIWIIVFLPLIGSLAYIFTEVVKKNDVSNLQSGVAQVVNPTGKIKNLEKKLKFSDTFSNRVALADAYLAARMYPEAASLYESALTGVFVDNEYAIQQLINTYYHLERYEDILKLAPRISKSMNFSKSETNLYYAFALEKAGKTDLVEREYREMNHRYSNFEQRYHFGCFLLRQNRAQEAAEVFHEIVEEAQQMSRKELGKGRAWVNKAYEEMGKLNTTA